MRRHQKHRMTWASGKLLGMRPLMRTCLTQSLRTRKPCRRKTPSLKNHVGHVTYDETCTLIPVRPYLCGFRDLKQTEKNAASCHASSPTPTTHVIQPTQATKPNWKPAQPTKQKDKIAVNCIKPNSIFLVEVNQNRHIPKPISNVHHAVTNACGGESLTDLQKVLRAESRHHVWHKQNVQGDNEAESREGHVIRKMPG